MPEEMTVTGAALHLGITRVMLSKTLNQKAGVSAEMALRLSKRLGTTPEMWAGIQSTWDLWEASRQNKSIVRPEMTRTKTNNEFKELVRLK